MKAILAVIVCLSVFISANCGGAAGENDLVVGQITASLEKKFKMLTGDKAFTNLGSKSGGDKGDILLCTINRTQTGRSPSASVP